jgi:TRAP-type transport system periplasmic protein
VSDVDKSGFETVSKPIQDEIAQQLGPHAVRILQLVRDAR